MHYRDAFTLRDAFVSRTRSRKLVVRLRSSAQRSKVTRLAGASRLPQALPLPQWRRGFMPLLVATFVGISLAGYFSLFQARFCDFRAFYCSGRVVLAGLDPYREHPLHECEHSL